jgi:hypothetical protein
VYATTLNKLRRSNIYLYLDELFIFEVKELARKHRRERSRFCIGKGARR